MTHTIETRDPHQVRTRHPLHKAHVPPPDKKSPEWGAFLETVRNDGRIRVPVSITKDNQVVDGWWRREAAHDLQLDSLPCVVVEDSEAALLIVETLTARKQMTRGAAVYLALGLLPEYAVAAEARRLRNKSGQRTTGEKPFSPKVSSTGHREEGSLRYLAERWGCARGTVEQAVTVRGLLHDAKAFQAWCERQDKPIFPVLPKGGYAELQTGLRAELEPLLFNGEKSLWTILQAIAGRLSTADKIKVVNQLELFGDDLGDWMARSAALPNMRGVVALVERKLTGLEDPDALERLAEVSDQIASSARARAAELRKTQAA